MASAIHSILEAANQLFRQRTTDSFARHRVAKPVSNEHEKDSALPSSRPHCCFRSLRTLAAILHLDCCTGIAASACLQASRSFFHRVCLLQKISAMSSNHVPNGSFAESVHKDTRSAALKSSIHSHPSPKLSAHHRNIVLSLLLLSAQCVTLHLCLEARPVGAYLTREEGCNRRSPRLFGQILCALRSTLRALPF